MRLVQEPNIPQHIRPMQKYSHEPGDGILEITASKTPSVNTELLKEQEDSIEKIADAIYNDSGKRHTKKSRLIKRSIAPISSQELADVHEILDKDVWENIDADLDTILDTMKFQPKIDNLELRTKSDRLIQELKDTFPRTQSDEYSTSGDERSESGDERTTFYDESKQQSSECPKTSEIQKQRRSSDRLIRELIRTLSHQESDIYCTSDNEAKETDNERIKSDDELEELSNEYVKHSSSRQPSRSSYSGVFKSQSDNDTEAGLTQKLTLRQHSDNTRKNGRGKKNSNRYRLIRCMLVPSSSSDEYQPKPVGKQNDVQSQLYLMEKYSQEPTAILEKQNRNVRTSSTKHQDKTPDSEQQHAYGQHLNTGVKDGQLESCIKALCSHKLYKGNTKSHQQRSCVVLPASSSRPENKLNNSQSQLIRTQYSQEPPGDTTCIWDVKTDQQNKNPIYIFKAQSDNEMEPGLVQRYTHGHQSNATVEDRQSDSGTKNQCRDKYVKHSHKNAIRLLKKNKNSYRLKHCVTIPSSSSDEYQPTPENKPNNSSSELFQVKKYSQDPDEDQSESNQQQSKISLRYSSKPYSENDMETSFAQKYTNSHQSRNTVKDGQSEFVTKERCSDNSFKLQKKNKHSCRLKPCFNVPSSSSDVYQPISGSKQKSYQLHGMDEYSQKAGCTTVDIPDEMKLEGQQQSKAPTYASKAHFRNDMEPPFTQKDTRGQQTRSAMKAEQKEFDMKEQCCDNSLNPEKNSAQSYGLKVYTLYPPLCSNEYQPQFENKLSNSQSQVYKIGQDTQEPINITNVIVRENINTIETQMQGKYSSSNINNDIDADLKQKHRPSQGSNSPVKDRQSELENDAFIRLCKQHTEQPSDIHCTVLPSSNYGDTQLRSNLQSMLGLTERRAQLAGYVVDDDQTKNTVYSKLQSQDIRCVLLPPSHSDKLQGLCDGVMNIPDKKQSKRTQISSTQQQSENSPSQPYLEECHVRDHGMKSEELPQKEDTRPQDKTADSDPDQPEERAMCLDESRFEHNGAMSDDTQQHTMDD